MSKQAIIGIIIAAVVVLTGGGVAAYFLFFNKEDAPIIKEDPHKGMAQSILTGEWMPENDAKQRPIAIMTENTKENQPTYGLNYAGVVYECPVEGSYTRLMPIYDRFDKVNQLGNVRSCRPYYVYLAHEFDSIYVHFGQCVYALSVLESSYIDNISGLDGSVESLAFYRTKEHAAPHNAYTTHDGILKAVEKKGYRKELNSDYKSKFTFAKDDQPNTLAVEGATDCKVVKPYFFYNKPWFVYDDATGMYKRFQFGGPQIDNTDQSQVEVKNIIFQDIDSSKYDSTEYLNIPTNGKGTGKYFTNGKMIDITWSRASDNDVTKYYDMQGNEIILNQGKTWICLTENQYKAKSQFFATVEEFNGTNTSAKK